MNWLDLLLLGILAFFVIAGLSRGLASQLIGLLGFFIAAVLAYFGSRYLSSTVAGYLNPDLFMPIQEAMELLKVDLTMDWVLNLVAGIITFVAFFFVLQLLLKVLAGSFRSLNRVPVLGLVNRLGGGVFGLLRGLVFILLLISIFSLLPVDILAEAVGGSRVAAAAEACLPAVTAGIKNLFLTLR